MSGIPKYKSKMSNFRAARNQIFASLSTLDCCGEEYRSEMESEGRKILNGGIIDPYYLVRAQFSKEAIAQAAITLCKEHYPHKNFKICNEIEGQLAVHAY